MSDRNGLKLALAAAFAAMATNAFAAGQDNTKSIAVSASVPNVCVVSAGSTLGFGNYDPITTNLTAALPGQGSFSVTCTKGATGVLVGLGLGANAGAGTQRKMSDGGTNTLNYDLFQPAGANFDTCPGSVAWDDSTSKLTVPAVFWSTGNASAKPIAVCGTVPGAQNASAGSYTDTVVIDVTF
jgi:spore coat protein U-like protein